QDAEEQERLQAPGESAQHRARGEEPETDQEEALAAEQAGEKAAGRQGNRVGDKIRGNDPGRLVLAHPHAAGDVSRATLAIVVSSTSMKVANATKMAISHGLGAEAPAPPAPVLIPTPSGARTPTTAARTPMAPD